MTIKITYADGFVTMTDEPDTPPPPRVAISIPSWFAVMLGFEAKFQKINAIRHLREFTKMQTGESAGLADAKNFIEAYEPNCSTVVEVANKKLVDLERRLELLEDRRDGCSVTTTETILNAVRQLRYN